MTGEETRDLEAISAEGEKAQKSHSVLFSNIPGLKNQPTETDGGVDSMLTHLDLTGLGVGPEEI
jgi:hypothetical protein